MGAVKELVGKKGRGQAPLKPATAPAAERSVTVLGAPEALYRAWLDASVLRRVMAHFADVTALADGRLHWVIAGPLGQSVAWDTRLVEERPFELLRWARVGEGLGGEAEVRFRPAPAGRGTVVTVGLRFGPAEGPRAEAARKLERALARHFVQARAARNFKCLMEAGEIPTTAHQPAARDGGRDP